MNMVNGFVYYDINEKYVYGSEEVDDEDSLF